MTTEAATKPKPRKGGFNLKNLDTIAACDKPYELEILHPGNNAPTGIFISVLGKDSQVYRGKVRAMANDNLQREASGRNSRKDNSLETLEAKNLDALVAATTGWRDGEDVGVLELGDERLEFSPANVRRVYTEILPIREQVAEAINDYRNFIPG